MLAVIICPSVSHHWAKLVRCCLYTSFFQQCLVLLGALRLMLCVFDIRSRCLHPEPRHRPGYAPSDAAFGTAAMNHPPVVIPFGSSAVQVALLRFLTYFSLTLGLLWNCYFLKEEYQSRLIEWKMLAGFVSPLTFCVTGNFTLDAFLVFFLVIFLQYFSAFWVPLYNFSSFLCCLQFFSSLHLQSI